METKAPCGGNYNSKLLLQYFIPPPRGGFAIFNSYQVGFVFLKASNIS
jgi:hypothetical protein